MNGVDARSSGQRLGDLLDPVSRGIQHHNVHIGPHTRNQGLIVRNRGIDEDHFCRRLTGTVRSHCAEKFLRRLLLRRRTIDSPLRRDRRLGLVLCHLLGFDLGRGRRRRRIKHQPLLEG